MLVAALIGIMISIVVGVSLIPAITGSLKEEAALVEGEPSGALNAIIDVFPIVFVAVIILGAVAWIGGISEGFSVGRLHISMRGICSFPLYIPNILAQMLGGFDRLVFGDRLKRAAKKARVDRQFVRKDLGLVPTPTPMDECDEPLAIYGGKLIIDKTFSWYPVGVEELDGHRTYTVIGKAGDYEKTFSLVKDLSTDRVKVKEVV